MENICKASDQVQQDLQSIIDSATQHFHDLTPTSTIFANSANHKNMANSFKPKDSIKPKAKLPDHWKILVEQLCSEDQFENVLLDKLDSDEEHNHPKFNCYKFQECVNVIYTGTGTLFNFYQQLQFILSIQCLHSPFRKIML